MINLQISHSRHDATLSVHKNCCDVPGSGTTTMSVQFLIRIWHKNDTGEWVIAREIIHNHVRHRLC